MCALYNAPNLKFGVLNSVFNPSDIQDNTEPITVAEGDERYLKLSGGTVSGTLSLTNGLTSNAAVNVPTVTLTSNTNAQTTNQIDFRVFLTRAITAGSVQNGTVSTPNFNTISLTAGVWVVTTYHNITCTASITFNYLQHGLTTSSTGVYDNTMSQSSFASETMANTGNKLCSGSYIIRPSTTTSYYAPILISYSTGGTITINMGITAIRMA